MFIFHEAGKFQKYTTEFLEIIPAQVKSSIRSDYLSSRKNKSASPKINSTQVYKLENFD